MKLEAEGDFLLYFAYLNIDAEVVLAQKEYPVE